MPEAGDQGAAKAGPPDVSGMVEKVEVRAFMVRMHQSKRLVRLSFGRLQGIEVFLCAASRVGKSFCCHA